jgi:hypothetical protein
MLPNIEKGLSPKMLSGSSSKEGTGGKLPNRARLLDWFFCPLLEVAGELED